MSVRPASSRILRALLWVRSRPTLPATATIPSSSISSGEASASRMATASSWPGSVSMMIWRFIAVVRRSAPGRRPGGGAQYLDLLGHQRVHGEHLLHVFLPGGVGAHRCPPVVAVLQAVIAPHQHRLVQVADLGGEQPDEMTEIPALQRQPLLLVFRHPAGDRAGPEGVGAVV